MQNYFEKLIVWWRLKNAHLHIASDSRVATDRGPIVILHGIASSSRYALPYVDILPKDRRIIFLDLLGYGDSPKIQHCDYSIDTHSKALLRTLAKLKIKNATVVGYSMGALIAVYSAAHSNRISRVICCSMPLFPYEQAGHMWHKILNQLYGTLTVRQSAALRITNLLAVLPDRFKGFQLDERTWPAFSSNMSNIISTYNPLVDAKKAKNISLIVGKFDPFVSVRATKDFARDSGVKDITVVKTPFHTLDKEYMRVLASKL